jgi:hypothetical protein
LFRAKSTSLLRCDFLSCLLWYQLLISSCLFRKWTYVFSLMRATRARSRSRSNSFYGHPSYPSALQKGNFYSRFEILVLQSSRFCSITNSDRRNRSNVVVALMFHNIYSTYTDHEFWISERKSKGNYKKLVYILFSLQFKEFNVTLTKVVYP